MRTAAQRIAKYEARMLSSLVDPTIAAAQALASANFKAYVQSFYPNQLALREILNAAGLQPIVYAAYEAFHGELFHLAQAFNGASLVAAFETLVAKWIDVQHLGPAAETLLREIGSTIYHIEELSTP
jgi:hypothetical protein